MMGIKALGCSKMKNEILLVLMVTSCLLACNDPKDARSSGHSSAQPKTSFGKAVKSAKDLKNKNAERIREVDRQAEVLNESE